MEKIETLAELQADLESWERHDYERSMSDGRWYSNGGHDHAVRQISAVKAKIAALSSQSIAQN